MKTIALTNGDIAIVDDEDYAQLSQYKWYLRTGNGTGGYAARNTHIGSLRDGSRRVRRICMHHAVLGNPDLGKTQVDHINRNKLDNRKENLRLVSNSINQLNRVPPRKNTSGITGVSLFKPTDRWQAYIGVGGRRILLGHFATKKLAASARALAEQRYYPGL